MVERQLRQRGIADERVLAAMAEVPRDAFVDPGQRGLAYADEALPIASGQTISQPWIVARMTELLGVGPGDRVLEVGTGSGYQAAVLAAMGCAVTTIERHPDLADAARERIVALGYGAASRGPGRGRERRRAGWGAVAGNPRRGRGAEDPRRAPRAARSGGRPAGAAGRAARAAGPDRRDPRRQRMGRAERRRGRVRAADRRGRRGAVPPREGIEATRAVGILGRP